MAAPDFTPTFVESRDFIGELELRGIPAAMAPFILTVVAPEHRLYWQRSATSPSESQIVHAALILRTDPAWREALRADPALAALSPAIAHLLARPALTNPPIPHTPEDWIVRALVSAAGEPILAQAWLHGSSQAIEDIRRWLHPVPAPSPTPIGAERNATPPPRATDIPGEFPLALPDWLYRYAALTPRPDHPWSGRITTLVSQATSASAFGLHAEDGTAIARLLTARLMLICPHLTPDCPADAALDAWLAATAMRASGWTPEQRRAWWHIEALAITSTVLTRWTTAVVQPAGIAAPATDKDDVAAAGQHWIAFARSTRAHDAGIAALFALDISEGLLDCLFAFGHGQAISLRRAAAAHHDTPA